MAQRQKTKASQPVSKTTEAEPAEPTKDKRTDFLTARQLAQLLQVSESTIHRLRRTGRIPAVLLTNRLIRFNLRDVRHALRPVLGRGAEGAEPLDVPGSQLSFEDISSEFSD